MILIPESAIGAFTPGIRPVGFAGRSRLSGAATPGGSARLTALLLSAVLSSGCAAAVTGRIQPSHFQFVSIVPQTEPGAGGWRAACVHAQVKNGTTGEVYTCIFGVEMP